MKIRAFQNLIQNVKKINPKGFKRLI